MRGGGPDQNLTVMDGVEVHNPYRLFGLTSAFNPETVDGFELITGAFSARYGDRLSSLLVVDNRAGTGRGVRARRRSASRTATSIVEGRLPAKDAARGSLTGRRTYYDLVAEPLTDTEPAVLRRRAGEARREPGARPSPDDVRAHQPRGHRRRPHRWQPAGRVYTRTRNDVLSLRFDPPARQTRRVVDASLYSDTADDRTSTAAPGRAALEAPVTTPARHPDRLELGTRRARSRDAAGDEPGAHESPHLEAGMEMHRLRSRVDYAIAGGRNVIEANGSSLQGGASLARALESARRTRGSAPG